MELRAKARVDSRTKNLIKRIEPGEIAVIDHADLDQVAADGLSIAKTKLVINVSRSITGRYPNPGPQLLLQSGVPIIDEAGPELLFKIREGDTIDIRDNQIWRDGILLGEGKLLVLDEVQKELRDIRRNLGTELDKFLHNTLEYASKEKELILGSLDIPEVETKFEHRPVLVVVRGQNYREDLTIIRPYIADVHPVLVGVDGGADALLEFHYQPDLIIGDMDSVSDAALKSGAELVVHAYLNGQAPGLKRVTELELPSKLFPAPGTSEDIALLLAYEKGADLIVAVGTHFSMIDFLEKGRLGMGSTFLVRLKVGSILVDARGVSKIYQGRIKFRYILQIAVAGFLVIVIVLSQTQWSRDLIRTLWLQLKVLLGL